MKTKIIKNLMRTCQNNIIYDRSKNGGIVDEFV